MAAEKRLSDTQIRKCPPGKYFDGGGLILVRATRSSKWVFRFTLHGRTRDMGLGKYPTITLAQARQERDRCRALLYQGTDPIKQRAAEAKRAERRDTSLNKIARDTFEARKAELKGEGKAGRWFSPIELHVLPKLGKMPIEEIDQLDVQKVLAPIWHTKADTARKAANRLKIILKHAKAMRINVNLMAVDEAKILLGKSKQKSAKIPSVDWRNVPDFYSTLSEPSITKLALRLLILTGARSYSLRFARTEQFQGDVWTIPAVNMKGRVEDVHDFHIPLPSEALHVIELAKAFERNGYLFPNTKCGVISDATMSRHMERRGMNERPHGFRSSLRTWLADCTDAPHEVCETVLAHTSGSKVVLSYRRTDFIEQRKPLMQRWAHHVTGENNILNLGRQNL